MSKIRIRVSRPIPCTREEVWPLLNNIKMYPRWFPRRLKPKGIIVNDKENFVFYPFPGVKVHWQKIWNNTDDSVTMRYMRGPAKGRTWWKIHEDGDYTYVENYMEIEPKNWFLAGFMRNPLFRWKHTLDMKLVLRNLEKHVRKGSGGV